MPGWDGSWSGSAVRRPPMGGPGRWRRWVRGSWMPQGSRCCRGAGRWPHLATVDLSGLREPPAGGVTCLTDVTAPLLGPLGAAAVFGPQKGADGAQIARLEAGLARLAEVLGGEPGAPGAGAAGGTGYGLATAWGAVLTPGAAELGRLAGLDRALAGADLVITGEGRFDETSLTGKTCGTADRRRRGGRGAGGGGRGPGERRARGTGSTGLGERGPRRGTPPDPRWSWRDRRPDRRGYPGRAGWRDRCCAGQPAAVAAAGGGAARQRYPGGKFPGLAGDLPGMGNPPDSGRAARRSRRGSR